MSLINPDLHNPGLIIYTSGTTENPKGAVLTQKSLVHDAQNIISSWKMRENDVPCHALPLFHVHGLCFALHTAFLSGTHVLMLDKFTPEIVLDEIPKNTMGKILKDSVKIFFHPASIHSFR